MIQHLVAHILLKNAPEGTVLVHDEIPEWNIGRTESPSEGQASEKIVLQTHLIAMRNAINRLHKSEDVEVDLRQLTARMEYYGHELPLARSLFPPPTSITGFGKKYLTIHVRTGDIYLGSHPNFVPLPVDYYRKLIHLTGLSPVFTGELDDNVYVQTLRREFPSAKFLQGTPIEDFQRIRTSTNIAIATSTFAWMAAWLSETAKSIYVPVLGIFNPLDRPDMDFVATRDPRYVYFRFGPQKFTGSEREINWQIRRTITLDRIASPKAYKAYAMARHWIRGRLPPDLSLWRGLRSALY